MYAVEINNFNYEEKLLNINLKIEKNTFNLLMGKNASAKTTLLYNIAYLNNFLNNKSTIKIEGKQLNEKNINLLRKSIGYIPQKQIFIKKIVSDEILFGLINLGNSIRSSKKKMYDTSKKLGIDYLLTKKTNELSESEKILVSICAVIVCEPKIIIIDNALDSLNYKLKEKVLHILKNMLTDLTVIYTTNNPEDIYMADNIIILDDKQLSCFKSNELVLDDKRLYKINSKLPFLSELSQKLLIYKIIDEPIYNEEEMINKIWK